MEKKNSNNFNSWINEPTAAKSSGLAFSVAAVLPSAFGVWFMIVFSLCGVSVSGENGYFDWYIYLNFLLPQVSFALAVLFGLRLYRKPIMGSMKQAAVKQKCHVKYFLIAILLQIGLFSLSEINAKFLQFLGEFGYQDAGIPIPSLDGFGVVGVLFVIGVLPAVFEEFFFRGVFLNGVRSFKVWSAVLLCGAFFALYHQNPAQTIYQFIVGSAFALVAIRSGSVFPTVLSHFLNNATIILLTKFGISSFSPTTLWIMLPICAVCLIGSLVYLIFIDKNKPEQSLETGEKQNLFKYASAGIAVCGVAWLITLMSGM
jgi:membrane protease YdiL (CAAX protease family)